MSGRCSPDRRAVLAAGALGGLVVAAGAAGCGAPARPTAAPKVDPDDPPDPDPRTPSPPAIGMTSPGRTPLAAPGERSTIMHIVAHPDDDLFFVNPEIQQSMDAGHRVIGVCVTAAEAGGRNGPSGRVSVQDYVKARQNALRAAYGRMAAADPTARWSRSTVAMPGGAQAEVDTLGQVTLIFMNIRKTPWNGRLRHLWAGRIDSLPTLVPTGAAVRRRYRYTRAELIEALAHLMDLYRPTLVRTLDLDPDLQVHNHRHPRKTDHGDLSDHEDHTATAQFSWAALSRYRGPGGTAHWAADSHRGYYNCRWPFNLSAPAWRAKQAVLHIYSGDAPLDCTDPAGCADLSTRGRIGPSGWGQSAHERYVATTPWLLPDATGRLTAFAVLDQQAAMWTETAPGSGRWTGPVMLGGEPLMPRLSASLSPDGRWQLLGVQIGRLGPEGQDHTRTVMLLEQQAAGGGFGPWTDLGTPEPGTRMRHLGVPVAAPTREGALRIFARTAGKTPATRLQRAGGSWTPWQVIGGPPVQEGLAALTTSDGRIELYGAGHASLIRWYQERPDGPFLPDRGLRLPAPATPPYAVELTDGGVLVVYRLAGSGQVAGFRRPRGSAVFIPAQIPLGGQGGVGPLQILPLPAAGNTPEQLVLLQRNDAGTTSVAVCPSSVTAPPPWTSTGPWLVRQPAAARDARNRIVIAGIGPDARLRTTTLTTTADTASWRLI